MGRFTVLSLMAAVALVALGLAAMRDGSEMAEMVSAIAGSLAILVGLLGAIVRRGSPAWVGFAMFSGAAMFAIPLSSEFPVVNAVRVEQLMLERLVNCLYRVPPEPALLAFSAYPGYRTDEPVRLYKNLGGHAVPLTPEEQEEVAQWNLATSVRLRYMEPIHERMERSKKIGQAVFAVIFGLIGAMVGRLLASNRWLMKAKKKVWEEREKEKRDRGDSSGA